jgi:hypothetical protein
LQGKKIIVITHHALLNKGTSDPDFEKKKRPFNHAFATDLSSTFTDDILCWIFGHTHYSTDNLFQKT